MVTFTFSLDIRVITYTIITGLEVNTGKYWPQTYRPNLRGLYVG